MPLLHNDKQNSLYHPSGLTEKEEIPMRDLKTESWILSACSVCDKCAIRPCKYNFNKEMFIICNKNQAFKIDAIL